MQEAQPQSEEMLTAEELAKKLKISVNRIYIMTRNGDLPHFRVGRAVRYSWKNVLEGLKKG